MSSTHRPRSLRLRLVLPLAALSILVVVVAGASAVTFQNTGLIYINDHQGPASAPYPSTMNVAGMGVSVTHMSMTLTGFSHTFPDDVDMLLVGPAGQTAVVMSDVGGSTAAANVNLTLDDAAGALLPDAGPLVSGSFRPTNIGLPTDNSESFNNYGVPASLAAPLSAFTGTNPNGTWSLYIVDDAASLTGSLAGGWSLSIETGGAPTVFSLPAVITINDATAALTTASSSPYPSNISVAGVPGNITDVNVTLNGLLHTFPDDVDALVVGPGANTLIMSDTCDGGDVSGLTLTFDDAAAAALPDNPAAASPCTSGTYKPSNFNTLENLPAPAPASNATVSLANFNGSSPNGTWSLYVNDDLSADVGRFATGWSVEITTDVPTAVEMAGLRATPTAGGVAVRWRTASEATLAGFNVYRGAKKLNRTLIPAKASGTARGASYSFVDRSAPLHGTLAYRVELVRTNGARVHGAATTLARS
jgi:subtilisin-like proprotein convertase family protein